VHLQNAKRPEKREREKGKEEDPVWKNRIASRIRHASVEALANDDKNLVTVFILDVYRAG